METIKSKKDLPEWFLKKVYKKNNNPIEWYREIRSRQYLCDFFELMGSKEPHKNNEHVRLWLKSINKDSIIYHINQNNKPVQPLSIFEACYLKAAMSDIKIDFAYKKLSKLIKMWRVEIERKDALLYTYNYEKYLRDFSGYLSENDWLFEDVLGVTEIGNPMLSYGRPLIGTPLVIDTQFDDATILKSMKAWLTEERKLHKEKAKRPLNQNDFDDWTYYKIREVIDLDIWSKLSGIKILDKVIASALWSDEVGDVSPIDILRTTVRKKIKEVFNNEMAVRFYGQLVQERGENFLDK